MSSSPDRNVNEAKDGNWQCSKHSEDDDLATPLDALLMLKKEAPPLKPNTNSIEYETRSKLKEIKVYTRRNKKGDSSRTTEKVDKLEEQKNSDSVIEEQGNNIIFQATKASNCAKTPDTNQVDKLLLLRDTMEALMNYSQGEEIQNYGRKCLYRADLRTRGETPKEKFERLRIRQKQRIAHRNLTIPFIPGKRLNVQEPVLLNPVPLSYISAQVDKFQSDSVDQICSPLNSCKNLSILRDPRRFRWYWDNFSGKDPAISWKPNSDVRCSTRPSAYLLSVMQNQTLVPRVVKNFPWASVGSNVAISSRLSPKPTMNSEKVEIRELETLWLEQELDSLWIGVRRHGEGKWEKILRDSRLYFSEIKTEQDLAQRWKTERQRILNSTQASQNQQNADSGKIEAQELLLGGLVSISMAQLDQYKSIKQP